MIKIDISGPGGCLNKEYELVRNALEKAGCKVKVNEVGFSAPDLNGNGFLKKHEELNLDVDEIRLDNTEVTVSVNELPWGG